ncbi:MAG TPA: metallophosphoesterase [Bryocella sp.]|nr:metallophosphoesterase [Bryocella sp.]
MIGAVLLGCSLVCSNAQQPSGAAQSRPVTFAVLADPQLGMYAKDKDSLQETANLEFVIANLNRLHPDFVVVCGDLTNRSGDEAEITAYKQMLKKLDASIPVYNVPGNHDVGNLPTASTLASYRSAYGPDYYVFHYAHILGIVLDSNLIRSPDHVPEEATKQEDWLRKTLASAPEGEQILVFQHIPYFLKDANEKDDYFNIPLAARTRYLDLLSADRVHFIFAGHYHRLAGGSDGALTEVVTGAVGMPLGGSSSGFRLVQIGPSGMKTEWYCLGNIPNRVENDLPKGGCSSGD